MGCVEFAAHDRLRPVQEKIRELVLLCFAFGAMGFPVSAYVQDAGLVAFQYARKLRFRVRVFARSGEMERLQDEERSFAKGLKRNIGGIVFEHEGVAKRVIQCGCAYTRLPCKPTKASRSPNSALRFSAMVSAHANASIALLCGWVLACVMRRHFSVGFSSAFVRCCAGVRTDRRRHFARFGADILHGAAQVLHATRFTEVSASMHCTQCALTSTTVPAS